MLVLGRKPYQRIVITVPGLATPIIIEQLDCEPNNSRLGFTADKSVVILREELVKRNEKDNPTNAE